MSEAIHNFNCVAMSTFEIKTHQIGRIYTKPHFFILNKGLNSGNPMKKPCPNCFVLTTQTDDALQTLFYLCLTLKIGRYFAYYLKGSVIPFITINDCSKVLKSTDSSTDNNREQLQKHIQIMNQIQQKEELIKENLKAIQQLKIAFAQTYFAKQVKGL